MPIALRFLGALSWLKRMALAYPWPAICLLLAAYALWEHHRASGLADYAHKLEQAGRAAKSAQAAMRAAETKSYQEKAREADANHVAGLDRARVLTRDFVDAHRVQPSTCRPAVAFREADPAAEPADLSRTPVVVDEADVRRAAEWQAYAVALHDWALSITGDK